MNKHIIAALKLYKLSLKNLIRVEGDNLKMKLILNGGRGCITLEGREVEIRRKRQKDGSLSFFRVRLEEPRFRARLNDYPWKEVSA